MLLEKAMKALEKAEALDEPAEAVVKVVGPAVRPRPVKNFLSGVWLGHRFHPLLVPLPIGFWSGALIFDLIASRRARWAADVLVGAGIATAVPTAAAGLSDWADAEPEGRFADGCVTCPWHGSTFRLEDGKVVRGPAAFSQPVYEARVTDGKIEVRAAP